MVWIFSDAILPKNIWCYLTNLNLLKYFTSRDEDLPASYIKKCKKFLEEITKKNKSSSAKLQEGIDYEVDNIDDYIKRVKSRKPQAPSNKQLDT